MTLQIENPAEEMNRKYSAASLGSALERMYIQARQAAYQNLQPSVEQELPRYPRQHLFQIQDEYHQKYSAASTGSTKESYYRQIRNIARNLLGYRP